jgi:hypothetical protein
LLTLAAIPRSAEARVTQFVVEQRRAFAGGMAWGESGPYERLDGTAYMEVDPHDPLNAVIVNLDKAPRNARGMVEFSSPFYILSATTLRYYHGSRTHLSLDKDAPEPRTVELPEHGSIVALPQVGGLHHRYVRRAA